MQPCSARSRPVSDESREKRPQGVTHAGGLCGTRSAFSRPAPSRAQTGLSQRVPARPRPDHSLERVRRLVYKTQVFVNHEGDLYRTRITHSIEVAQIARSAAVALRLNETLTEAVSLAHDLGHTPFGTLARMPQCLHASLWRL